MNWIDTIVVSAVIGVGLIILYKALKEPIDLLFSGIKKLFGFFGEKIGDATSNGYYEEIRYG